VRALKNAPAIIAAADHIASADEIKPESRAFLGME